MNRQTFKAFTRAGCKIHAGTRQYAVLPRSFAVKPLKCAEGARHDLLPCPVSQNDQKSFEIGEKVHVKLTTNHYSVPQYLFSIVHAFVSLAGHGSNDLDQHVLCKSACLIVMTF